VTETCPGLSFRAGFIGEESAFLPAAEKADSPRENRASE